MLILQKFGFKESRYERPQDGWVCGHLADGRPCTRGPDRRGRCRVTTVCTPRQENGRWRCRRSAQEGGPCEAGPFPDGRCCLAQTPCQPQPSLRTRRGRAARWATALAVGIVALLLGAGTANRYVMPGPLTSPHAGLTDCTSCHAGAGPGRLDWVHTLVQTVSAEQNAKLCLGCHTLGAQPFAPHSHPVDELKRLTEASRDTFKGSPGLLHRVGLTRTVSLPSGGEKIYCATCHKEHRGEFTNLKQVSNQRCQTCHVAKFGSFAASHPEFADYPYRRRTRIVFDHSAHIEKYFAEAVKDPASPQPPGQSCNGCHQPGFDQKYMEVKSYESMCASCHQKDILGTGRTTGPKGIDFLSAPGLDVTTLKEKKVDIGNWPTTSEAQITPFMKLLLTASGETVHLEMGDIDLIDLSQADDDALAKVKSLAWAIKRIFGRLETETLDAIIGGAARGRAAQGGAAPEGAAKEGAAQGGAAQSGAAQSGAAQAGAGRQQLAVLTGMISHDVILGANREWFPGLHEDLKNHEAGEPTEAFKDPDKEPEKPEAAAPFDAEAWAEYGGWYRQDYNIRYRPSGHADRFLRGWLEFAAQSAAAGPDSPLQPVYELLASQEAVGRCARCHSIDSTESGAKQVNWRPFYTDHHKNRFTSFAHKLHTAAVGTKGCTACHELREAGGDYTKSYADNDPSVHAPNFKPIDKALCASCHTRQASWESCTLCHDYHVTDSKDSSRLGRRAATAAK
jgi:hypothetical protein